MPGNQAWKLKRTAQCKKCPWRKDVDPHDIPNGYCETKHANLAGTIAEPGALPNLSQPMRVMACHETADAHCVGWLMNQAGPGNNIGLRLQLMSCENISKVRLVGEQHPTFEDTLP
jgi:hypothetical protein